MGGKGGSGPSGGTGGAGGAGDAQTGGGAGGSLGAGGSAGTGGAGGGAECSADEEKCSENTPQSCVDGRWESGAPCVAQTCVDGKCTGRCGPGEVRCLHNQPQRCHEYGDWEDAEPCPARASTCQAGECVPPSCVGLPDTCGPNGDESCCATAEAVPGGTFNRDNDPVYPATVSGFLLDRFEVTVGRFRRFVEAYPGSRPEAGAGAHPRIEDSGWDPNWDSNLPADAAALRTAVKCDVTYQTWTDGSSDHEHLPMNCLSWDVAFAFCAWDGGRLPTEAEWNYAAAGGSQQRLYPWSASASDDAIDTSHAVYDCRADGSASSACALSDIQPVGSKSPTGDGRWRQADLAGNMSELILDWHADYPANCTDCANMLSTPARVTRGGSFRGRASAMLSSLRGVSGQSDRLNYVGARCARALSP
ncbi:formylglycine-generating enzyme family protein [Sorangium sp. So ce1099]|uniref:formylglycine-generating enzyme family protein n=1 Tax=Sorangium sp. So ce1099 TaxID=3133331 RepID=UPI003F603644